METINLIYVGQHGPDRVWLSPKKVAAEIAFERALVEVQLQVELNQE